MKTFIFVALISFSTSVFAGQKIMNLLAIKWVKSQSSIVSTPVHNYLSRIEVEYSNDLGTRVGHHIIANIKVLPVQVELISRQYCSYSRTVPGQTNCSSMNDIVKYIVSVPYEHTFSGGFGTYSTLFSLIVDKKVQWIEDENGKKSDTRETIEYRFSEDIE